jgi:4-amino-4-deoxy-L-arabinose transferase-like glycosyltransferase
MNWRRFGLTALAILYFAIPNARPDFSRFNCHDSEQYLALSYGLVHGLGYTRSMIPGRYVAHTTWPPGIPCLMTPAVALSGKRVNWLFVKWTIAAVGIVGVVAAWKLVRRYGGSVLTADLAAFLVAFNPFYWDFSHQVMAETPLAVWIWLSLLAIDIACSSRTPNPAVLCAVGMFSGLGMIIKGHAIGLILAPLAYLSGPRRSTIEKSRFLRLWLLFCLAFTLPFAAWMVRNRTVNASGGDGINQIRMIRAKEPMQIDSPLLTLPESLTVVSNNVKSLLIHSIPSQILPGLWADASTRWPRSRLVFLLLTLFSLLIITVAYPFTRWPNGLQVTLAPIVVLNLQFVGGGSGRYWVPVSTSLLILAMLRLGPQIEGVSGRRRVVLIGAVAIAVVLSFAAYVLQHERTPYNEEGPWRQLAELFEASAKTDLHASGVLTPNPQAFQLTTGQPATSITSAELTSADFVVMNRSDPGQTAPADSCVVLSNPPLELRRLDLPLPIEMLSRLGLGKLGKRQ